MSEEWRAIPGWDSLYEVSNQGQVVSLKRRIDRQLKRIEGAGGYTVHLSRDNKSSHFLVHRLVLMAFRPVKQPHDYRVRFLNENKYDPRLENIEWYQFAGESVAQSKLTSLQVRAIRDRWKWESGADLSRAFGVSQNAISLIVSGETWRHVS